MQEMIDENHVLKDTVRRLNVELSKYQEKYGDDPGALDDVSGIPADGPVPKWLVGDLLISLGYACNSPVLTLALFVKRMHVGLLLEIRAVSLSAWCRLAKILPSRTASDLTRDVLLRDRSIHGTYHRYSRVTTRRSNWGTKWSPSTTLKARN